MGESVDIKYRNSLKVWLESQPREVAVWIAWRAAARVLPVWWDGVSSEPLARKRGLTALPILRTILILSVAVEMPTDTINAAAADATRSAHLSPVDRATHAADTAARAAHAATTNTADHATYAAEACGLAALSTTAQATWPAVRTDVELVANGHIPKVVPLWPEGRGPLAEQWRAIKWEVTNSEGSEDWQFWIEWYDALLDGRLMLGDAGRTWEMLEQIALIDPETWDKGPEVVNAVIREIWQSYEEGGLYSGSSADPKPVSEDAKSAMKQRVVVNRDALAVAGAGLMDQLAAFRDRVRGMNHLESDTRAEVLAFIDEFSGKLSALLEGLPPPGTSLDDDQAGRLVIWLREYRGLLRHKLAYYGSAENMAEATVPTGIILGATGIGAMLGMPVAGSVVGGLIVNQMKPGQAAKELTERSSKDGDAG